MGLSGVMALSACCHPARGLAVMGSVALHVVSAGVLPWVEAFAMLSGQPVVVMAARAVLLAGGWRRAVGGLGLAAWARGLHVSRGRSASLHAQAQDHAACMVLSLLVAGAGLGDGPWVSGLVLGAPW